MHTTLTLRCFLAARNLPCIDRVPASRKVEVQPGCGRFSAINLVLPIHQLKQVRGRANDAFRRPQHQKSPWLQRIMKDGHDPFLQNRLEVDQHVPATDDVDPRKRRILEKIVPSETTTIPDRFINSIATFHFAEKPSQALRRDIPPNTLRVGPRAGFLNTSLAEVRAKKLEGNIAASIPQELDQRNCLRVGLLAR